MARSELLRWPATVEYTVPLVIQDRMFDTEGQLFYQSDSAGGVLWATNPEHPYWTPEFLGDVIVVNGKAWPNLNVEPKRYRFWLINGSNARTYELRIPDPVTGLNMPLYVIATDGGYLDAPAMTNKLVIMPGERYEVIIDFQGFAAGTKLIMKNSAKSPYPAGARGSGEHHRADHAVHRWCMHERLLRCNRRQLQPGSDSSHPTRLTRSCVWQTLSPEP